MARPVVSFIKRNFGRLHKRSVLPAAPSAGHGTLFNYLGEWYEIDESGVITPMRALSLLAPDDSADVYALTKRVPRRTVLNPSANLAEFRLAARPDARKAFEWTAANAVMVGQGGLTATGSQSVQNADTHYVLLSDTVGANNIGYVTNGFDFCRFSHSPFLHWRIRTPSDWISAPFSTTAWFALLDVNIAALTSGSNDTLPAGTSGFGFRLSKGASPPVDLNFNPFVVNNAAAPTYVTASGFPAMANSTTYDLYAWYDYPGGAIKFQIDNSTIYSATTGLPTANNVLYFGSSIQATSGNVGALGPVLSYSRQSVTID